MPSLELTGQWTGKRSCCLCSSCD